MKLDLEDHLRCYHCKKKGMSHISTQRLGVILPFTLLIIIPFNLITIYQYNIPRQQGLNPYEILITHTASFMLEHIAASLLLLSIQTFRMIAEMWPVHRSRPRTLTGFVTQQFIHFVWTVWDGHCGSYLPHHRRPLASTDFQNLRQTILKFPSTTDTIVSICE